MKIQRRVFLQQFASGLLFMAVPIKQNYLMNNQGIITRISPFGVKETIDKLVALLEKNGATVYSRINQQEEIRRSGREILPMEFILFGNPANGGAIMATNPIAALDLPLKILVWQSDDQIVRVAFNDAEYIQNRYLLPAKLITALNLTPLVDKALL